MQSKISNRLAFIGLPGSGKSTFAAKLGQRLEIPVHHLDSYMFVAGGKKREKQEFLALQKTLVDQERWIIEGCSTSTLEMRFARADTVVYFRLPRLLCLWRAFKRLFFHDNTLCDTAEGCSKVFTWEIVKYIWNFDREKGELIEELKKKYPHVRFYIFKSSKDTERFYNSSSVC